MPKTLIILKPCGWFDAYVTFPKPYSPYEVNTTTIRINNTLAPAYTSVAPYKSEMSFKARFQRCQIISFILSNLSHEQWVKLIRNDKTTVTLTISGMFNNNQCFEATNQITLTFPRCRICSCGEALCRIYSCGEAL